jgi:hypothetical protein
MLAYSFITVLIALGKLVALGKNQVGSPSPSSFRNNRSSVTLKRSSATRAHPPPSPLLHPPRARLPGRPPRAERRLSWAGDTRAAPDRPGGRGPAQSRKQWMALALITGGILINAKVRPVYLLRDSL